MGLLCLLRTVGPKREKLRGFNRFGSESTSSRIVMLDLGMTVFKICVLDVCVLVYMDLVCVMYVV